jgi:hypothetical protein
MNKKHGIPAVEFVNCPGAQIDGCTIEENHGPGLRIDPESFKTMKMSGTKIARNGGAGIVVEPAAPAPTEPKRTRVAEAVGAALGAGVGAATKVLIGQ